MAVFILKKKKKEPGRITIIRHCGGEKGVEWEGNRGNPEETEEYEENQGSCCGRKRTIVRWQILWGRQRR